MPRYDRGTEEQLHFSSRKRPAGVLLAAEAAAATAAGRPIKRLRGSTRCAAVGLAYGAGGLRQLSDCSYETQPTCCGPWIVWHAPGCPIHML